MGEALYRKFKATGDKKYYVAPKDGFLSIDALGFRRGAGVLKTLLQEQGTRRRAAVRAGERGQPRHSRAVGPYRIDRPEQRRQRRTVGGGPGDCSREGRVLGHGRRSRGSAQGDRLRRRVRAVRRSRAGVEDAGARAEGRQAASRHVLGNNAGIDDSLMGGVIDAKYTGYDFIEQWKSYGWNVMTMSNGHDYDQIVGALKAMDDVDPSDRRPIIVIGKTIKGYWPTAANGKIAASTDQVVGYPSHPYAMKMNSDYFVALCKTFEDKYGVEFQGIRNGAVTDTKQRLIQFKTNMDVAMSLLDKNGLGDWLADRIVEIGDQVKDDFKLSIDVKQDPFLDDRLRVANLPTDTQTVKVKNPSSGAEKEVKIALFKKAGEVAGARRGFRK
jgi:hypothetical protein